MNKQWRLVFIWPTLTLVQVDGPVTEIVPDVGSAMLGLIGHLSDGDTILFQANA